MIFRFGEFELDTDGIRLRSCDDEIAVEPQVFSLPQFLIENHERVISNDEIINSPIANNLATKESCFDSQINRSSSTLSANSGTRPGAGRSSSASTTWCSRPMRRSEATPSAS